MARPKYENRGRIQGSRQGRGTRTTKARFVPSGPTRLVITANGTVEGKGATQIIHWPAVGKDRDMLFWTCPDCKLQFTREDIHSNWRQL